MPRATRTKMRSHSRDLIPPFAFLATRIDSGGIFIHALHVRVSRIRIAVVVRAADPRTIGALKSARPVPPAEINDIRVDRFMM